MHALWYFEFFLLLIREIHYIEIFSINYNYNLLFKSYMNTKDILFHRKYSKRICNCLGFLSDTLLSNTYESGPFLL